MNKTITTLAASMAICATASADITVNVAPAVAQKEYDLEYGYIADMVKPRNERN